MIEDVGALVHYLPPYCPDCNPIELAFSKAKRCIKDLEVSMADADIETLVTAAFASISKKTARVG